MPKFDFPTAILELAEATEPCPYDKVRPHFERCKGRCNGTGRIVLFPSLRVDNDENIHCPERSHTPCVEHHVCVLWGVETNCEGRGWVPVPDVRVACWEIIEELVKRGYKVSVYQDGPGYRADISNASSAVTGWSDGFGDNAYDPLIAAPYEPTPTEAVIRAVQAWVKEQHG